MPEMTGTERVQTAIRCEKPDRVPMIPMFGFFDARYKSVPLVDFVNDQDLARDLAIEVLKSLAAVIWCSHPPP